MNDKFELTGKLKFISLADLIQLLGTNRNTGTLRIVNQYISAPAFVYFKDGNIVDSSFGSLSGIDALHPLFGWIDGDFQFHDEMTETPDVIKMGRMEIILDALRLLDDGKIKQVGEAVLATTKVSEASGNISSIPLIKGPLVDYMYVVDEEEFFDKEKILEERKYGKWIWVILDGFVEVFKDTDTEKSKIICRIGNGAFVGSLLSLLTRGHSRGASAVAVGKVVLGVLDSQRLSTEYARAGSDFRQIITSFERRLKQLTEKLFTNDENDILLNKKINIDEPLMNQGDDGNSLYLITEGEAFVVKKKEGKNILLATLHKGDYIGRVPFFNITHEPSSASVFRTKNLIVKKMDTISLEKEYNQISSTFKNILEHTGNCISFTTKMICEA